MTPTPRSPEGPPPGHAHPANAGLPGRPLRLGCRRAHLARAYAHRVIDALHQAAPGLPIDLVEITTSGDRHQSDLSKLGGKGLFIKEIDQALTRGEIDLAVHCIKDVVRHEVALSE